MRTRTRRCDDADLGGMYAMVCDGQDEDITPCHDFPCRPGGHSRCVYQNMYLPYGMHREYENNVIMSPRLMFSNASKLLIFTTTLYVERKQKSIIVREILLKLNCYWKLTY